MIADAETLARLSDSLHERIPMTRYLEVRLIAFEPERIALAAPIAPTRNHRGTAFGPGVFTTAALAPWLLLVRWMWARRVSARIVLRHSEFRLHQPIEREFRASCEALPTIDLDTLYDIGKVRLSASAQVLAEPGDPAAIYTGHFTVLHAPSDACEGDLDLPFPEAWRL